MSIDIFQKSQQGLYSNPNLFINGDMSVWQRGTSFTGYVYGCDRWLCTHSTVTQSTSTEHGVSLKVTRNVENATLVAQPVELELIGSTPTVKPFNLGGTYTLSMRVLTANRVRPSIGYWDSSGSGLTQAATDTTLDAQGSGSTGNFQTLTWTFDIDYLPISSNRCLMVGIIGETANVQVEFFEMKLERGSVATPFVPDDPATNLAKCQRYYEAAVYGGFSGGGTYNMSLNFFVPKRTVTPTVTFDGGGTINLVTAYGFRWSGASGSFNYQADAEL